MSRGVEAGEGPTGGSGNGAIRCALSVLVFLLGALAAYTLARTPPVVNDAVHHSIPFNHKAHIDNGVECTQCHTGVEERDGADLPDMENCMGCHESPVTSSPAEALLIQMAKEKKPLVWKPVTVLDHGGLGFSHRRHVKTAKLECQVCHGDMKQRTVPPETPAIALSMAFCLDCHKQRGVDRDCLTCHR